MIKDEVAVAMVAAVLLGLYVYSRGVGGVAADAGKGLINGIVGFVDGVGTGINDALGIGQTTTQSAQSGPWYSTN